MTPNTRLAVACVAALAAALALCASPAHGHNWMTSPASRNDNADSTAKPCESSTKKWMFAEAGEALFINWTTNHPNTPHFIRAVAAANENMLENATAGELGILLHNTSYTAMVASTSSFRVPASAAEGDEFVVQYVWGTYRNCFDVRVPWSAPSGYALVDEDVPFVYNLPAGDGTFDARTGVTTCNDASVTATSCGGATAVCGGSCPSSAPSTSKSSSAAIGGGIVAAVVLALAGVGIYVFRNNKASYVVPKGGKAASSAQTQQTAHHTQDAYPASSDTVYQSEAAPGELPEGWISATDDQGMVYYYNTITQQSQWEAPQM